MAHHTNSGKTYVDTSFVNDSQRIPGVSLTHMGMGEFYAETPKGRVDFDRMRGRDFPGQSGRSHEIRGKGADWLVKQMEGKGKSDRVASSFWIEQFKALDSVLPRYDASDVAGWNKVDKHYRASGLGPGAAASAAHWYHEYKSGNSTLQQAAAGASKDIRPGQANRLIGRPVAAAGGYVGYLENDAGYMLRFWGPTISLNALKRLERSPEVSQVMDEGGSFAKVPLKNAIQEFSTFTPGHSWFKLLPQRDLMAVESVLGMGKTSGLRSGLIRLAAAQPQGSPERTALVAMLTKTSKIMSRQVKVLQKYLDSAGSRAESYYDNLPAKVQTDLRKIKDQETLPSDVDRWLSDNK